MTIYIFKIYFNILGEAGISISGLEIEPVAFSTVALKTNKDLTGTQLKTIQTKLANFFNNKFGLTTAKAQLEQQIQ